MCYTILFLGVTANEDVATDDEGKIKCLIFLDGDSVIAAILMDKNDVGLWIGGII
jgi:hypothetical protein